MNAVFEVWPGKRWAEWGISAGDGRADAGQHPVGFPCRSSTLLARIELLVHQHPQVPLHRAAPQPGRSQPAGICVLIALTEIFEECRK